MDIFTKNKERKVKNLKLVSHLENISKSESFKLIRDKPESKSYKKMELLIMKAGLNRSPELIKLLSYLVPLLVFFILIIVKHTNIISAKLNIDQLREVSRLIGDENIANVNTKINYGNLFLVSMLFYFLPTLALKFLASFRAIKSQSEVIMLQTYAIILLKTGQSVKQILIVLLDRSNLFKPYLERAVNSYSQDPIKTLKILRESTPNKHFEKIVMSLEQALRLNRNTSIKYLETHRDLGKELNRINKRTRDSKKKMIGVLMLIIPLATLMAVGGYPWLLFSLKVMNGMPF